MPRNPTRPTVATIARDLGVSAATVSYALNDKPGVSPAMRRRVVEHAHAVGWVPNFGARALRRGRTGNVGLVLVRDPKEVSREPFYASVTAGIESAASAQGSELLLRFVEGGVEEELSVFRTWADQRRVDGVVLLDLVLEDPRPHALSELGLPFSVLGEYSGPESFVKVSSSEAGDAEMIARHLDDCGYEACLQISGPLFYGHEVRRRDLLADLCGRRGIRHAHAEGAYTVEGGSEALRSLADEMSGRWAVVASSDLIAAGAVREIRSRGFSVPSQTGVVSWDDSLIAELMTPSVTALSRNPYEKGRAAGRLLAGLIDGAVPAGTVQTAEESRLVQRSSTAPR
ncbi:LacI family DNA-binding transcriptional regulator [Brachybacterium subflavum]|uniref:LacI family DNA-binding transcriptional regulator n=1 Tax=Brachybacterium subflavum TaxID=2585206 RepID=UPI00187A12E3|nr:LacI family DNA-binding transcriptional regulator [Brachybacterium subflavum]